MSKRDYLLRQIAENEAAERRRRQERKETRRYSAGEMDCEKMPFGCWIVLGIILFIVITLSKKFLGL